MPTPRIDIPMPQLTAFCQKWKIVELSLFGSVLRDDFGPESDIDVMIVFHHDAARTMLDLAAMQRSLVKLFGRNVDLLTRNGVEHSRNPIRKKSILSSAEVVYAA